MVTTKIPYPQDPDELRFVSDGVAYYQSPASKWMREFEKKIVDIKKVTTGNVLIKNLQFNHKQGLTLVNKTQDPINLAHLQTAFLDMRKLPGHEAPDSMKYSQLQMDLFKYVLLKDGLSFSKVSLSPIFPVEFYSAYSRAMEARMAAVFGHTYSPTSFAKSEILGEAFKYQFLRNRIMDLKWVSYTKRVTKYPSIPQSFDRVYKGANHPDYFRDTSSSSVRVFKKVHVLETENGSFTYYIEIPSTSTAYYEFDFSLFETGFAFEKAVGADNDSRRLFYIDYQGALNFTSEIKDLKVGEVVRIMDRKTASPTVQTIAKIREIAAADEKGKRNLYRFDIIGEESLGSEAQLENLTEISDSYNTRSSVSMPINSLIGVAGKSSFIVMAVGSVDPTKGVAADQTLYRGVSNMSNIKPLVVYDIPAVEAISNIDRFFEEIKDDPRVLAFDRDRLYSLPKSGDLDINVTEYLLSKLREERKYTDTVVSSLETFETLPDTKECN